MAASDHWQKLKELETFHSASLQSNYYGLNVGIQKIFQKEVGASKGCEK